MTTAQIRAIAELSRRAALLAAGQPSPVAVVMRAEHMRLQSALTSATLR